MLAASIDVEPAHKAAVTTTFMQVARIWHLSVCAKQVEVALDYDRKNATVYPHWARCAAFQPLICLALSSTTRFWRRRCRIRPSTILDPPVVHLPSSCSFLPIPFCCFPFRPIHSSLIDASLIEAIRPPLPSILRRWPSIPRYLIV
ncbi:hypothetical protein V2G26_014677 [Clonostachys chloroleuca]